jgi:hypothetical protein
MLRKNSTFVCEIPQQQLTDTIKFISYCPADVMFYVYVNFRQVRISGVGLELQCSLPDDLQ